MSRAAGELERLALLENDNRQLTRALESRVAIEQAKGVLSERLKVDPDVAFELLRRAARNRQRPLHELAAEVSARAATPPDVVELLPLIPTLEILAASRNGGRPHS